MAERFHYFHYIPYVLYPVEVEFVVHMFFSDSLDREQIFRSKIIEKHFENNF